MSSPQFSLHSSASALKGEITKKDLVEKISFKDLIQKVFPDAGGEVKRRSSFVIFNLARWFYTGLNILMKYGIYLILTTALVYGAYKTAQVKIERPINLEAVHLGMASNEIEATFGTPSAKNGNKIVYILEDGSELVLTIREKTLSSATIKFRKLVQIQDPDMRKLSLVQMDMREEAGLSWFLAGNPEEGLIYKVTSEGIVESLTWVPPFTYGSGRPKQLQALLRDFRGQKRL